MGKSHSGCCCRLQGSSVEVFSVHPGMIDSGLSRHMAWPVRFAISYLSYFFLKSAEQVSQLPFSCSLSMCNKRGGRCKQANCRASHYTMCDIKACLDTVHCCSVIHFMTLFAIMTCLNCYASCVCCEISVKPSHDAIGDHVVHFK